MAAPSFFKDVGSSIRAEAAQWCRGRNWWIRAPLLVWFVFLLVNFLKDPQYGSVFGPLNLGIHELGHLVFSFGGMFVQILGGTLLECLAPVYGVYNFYRQRDYFAIALCFGWMSTVLFDVSRYVGDARAMSLPLVTPFGFDSPITHDWNYLLGRMGLLPYDGLIAGMIKALAVLSMLAALAMGAWLLRRMATDTSGVPASRKV